MARIMVGVGSVWMAAALCCWAQTDMRAAEADLRGFDCDDRVLNRFDRVVGPIDVENRDDDCRLGPDRQAAWVELKFRPDPGRVTVAFEANLNELSLSGSDKLTLFDLQRADGSAIVSLKVEPRAQGGHSLVTSWSDSGTFGTLMEPVFLMDYDVIRVSWQASSSGQNDGWIRIRLNRTELGSAENLNLTEQDQPVLARVGALDWDPSYVGRLWFRPLESRWWFFRPSGASGQNGK